MIHTGQTIACKVIPKTETMEFCKDLVVHYFQKDCEATLRALCLCVQRISRRGAEGAEIKQLRCF
jgi:hypothetical protein